MFGGVESVDPETTRIVLHCGNTFGTMHGEHEWRWRRVSIPTDATGETTPYRWCPGSDAVCSFAGCPECGRHFSPHQITGEAHYDGDGCQS